MVLWQRKGGSSGASLSLVAVCGFSVVQRWAVLGYLWVVVGSAGCWLRRWKEKLIGASDGFNGFRRDFSNFVFFSDIFPLDFSDLSCIKVMERLEKVIMPFRSIFSYLFLEKGGLL